MRDSSFRGFATENIYRMVFLTLLILFSTSLLHAQTDTPEVITNGIAAYQKSGAEAAVAAWLKGSPIENDTTAIAGLIGGMGQMQAAYGKITGYEIVRTVSITPSFRFIYLILKLEKGPVFAKFDCYNTGKSWIVTQLILNTKAGTVWPEALLLGR